MRVLVRGLSVALLSLAVLAPAALADRTVTIRIEGESTTLVPKTTVTLPDSGSIPGGDPECAWPEASGAIERATGGRWDRQAFTSTILGEHHDAINTNESWFEWKNGQLGGGICFDEVQNGDDVLILAGTYNSSYETETYPLYVRGVPERVERGVPFTVSVVEHVPDFNNGSYGTGSGVPRPATGATVRVGPAVATVAPDGSATLVLGESGRFMLRADRDNAGSRSEQIPVCVSCDPASVPPPGEEPPAATPDRTDPLADLAIRNGARFARKKAPRVVRGSIADDSALRQVKLRLTRNSRDRCSTYSKTRERFVRRRCGADHGYWFSIGTRTDWEYQLARRLRRGRYVLDVKAWDQAWNVDSERRLGLNRVIFRVR